MGKALGREWKLSISTPREALALIEANTGKVFSWMKNNLEKYSAYKVLAVFKNGKKEYLTQDTLLTAHNVKELRFTPVVQGAGRNGKIIGGIVLMVASIWLGPMAFQAGIALALSGVSELLAPKVKTGSTKTSHYFQGVTNTVAQGDPVPLIYGRCRVGSAPISVRTSVNDLSQYNSETNAIKGYSHGSSNSSNGA